MDIVEAARMFAAVDMSMADTMISIWHAKYKYGAWRPITAIVEAHTDGNPATAADKSWQPLLVTPPYPDYVGGYAGFTCSFTRALENTLKTRELNLTLVTSVPPFPATTHRFYRTGRELCADVVDARVWLGIHFRYADTAGARMGEMVSDWALDRNFLPVRGHR